jgi:hypothetical protein
VHGGGGRRRGHGFRLRGGGERWSEAQAQSYITIAGQFPGSLYGGSLAGLGMGSLQTLARGGRPGSGSGLGGLGEGGGGRGGGGGLPPMSSGSMSQGLHSQGLQGRLTPTQFGGGRSMGGLGGHSMGLLQTSVTGGRNPLFSRKMG